MRPPEDKVKAVKEILSEIDFETAEFDRDDTATQICQLFPTKVKLPEKPTYWSKETMDFHVGYYRCEQDFKDALKKAGVEVEE